MDVEQAGVDVGVAGEAALGMDGVKDGVIQEIAFRIADHGGDVHGEGMTDLIVGARAFLAGHQHVFAVDHAMGGAKAALFKVGAIDVAHLHDIRQMHVLGLDPRHHVAGIVVAQDPGVHVIVARPPAQLAHVHPAARAQSALGGFTRNDGDIFKHHLVFDAAADADLPYPRRQRHVERPRHAPEMRAERPGQVGGAHPAGMALTVELRGELDAVGRAPLQAVRPPHEPHHGGSGFAGIVGEYRELEPAGQRGGHLERHGQRRLARDG
jgi:hypothetical protein